ncbi:hypothetical protein [Roseofilum casamattae]|uniref:Adenine DNA glycosylase n=1 Tax=Roseofilum casamattae BLCC-M143 TaxID=3022442 RepID=A0ABT7BRH6_9CYAN|nr:hypothetical protein [Roseofilum casamattae]MDJ1181801.1 A/G-specific adenine glycosylase [Roseofilum casamattae BLCC-M143]
MTNATAKRKNGNKLLKPAKVAWFRSQLVAWADTHLRDFPWRRTRDPYHLFVAECLLQKTDATTVAPIYETFLTRYPTLETLAAANVEEVARLLQPLGLFFRAERLCKSARIILNSDRGTIPNSEKGLLQLPGIGKYSARAILANAFSQPAAVLDTNVARILERFFGVKGGRVKSRCPVLWEAADTVARDRDTDKWNLTLLDLGALICTARNPRCAQCPLQEQCQSADFLSFC